MTPDPSKTYRWYTGKDTARVLFFDERTVYVEFSNGDRDDYKREEFSEFFVDPTPAPPKPRRVWVHFMRNDPIEVSPERIEGMSVEFIELTPAIRALLLEVEA